MEIDPETRFPLMPPQPLQTREEWLARRRLGLGSSDIARVLGLHPTKTAYDVYCEKRGLIEDEEGNERMEWGKALEQIIAGRWGKKRQVPVMWLDRTVPGPEPFIFATPDFEISGTEGGEVKNIGYCGDAWGQEETDEIPVQYGCQAQWVLLVTGWERIWLAVLEGGNRLRTYVVGADIALQGDMIEAARNFWQKHVLAGEPPPMDWSEGASTYLQYRFPKATEGPRPATDEEYELAAEFARVREQKKQTDRMYKSLSNVLKERIGDAKAIVGEDFKLTWYERRASTYTVNHPGGRILKPGGPMFKSSQEGDNGEEG